MCNNNSLHRYVYMHVNAGKVGSCHTHDLEFSFKQGKKYCRVCSLGAQKEYDIRIKREEKENRWQQLFLFRDLVKFLA